MHEPVQHRLLLLELSHGPGDAVVVKNTVRCTVPLTIGVNAVVLLATDANGNGAKPITSGGEGVASPTWSPDGKALAFVKNGNIAYRTSGKTGVVAMLSKYTFFISVFISPPPD